jgi:competence protein ComEC
VANRMLCCLTLSLLCGVWYGREGSPLAAAGMLLFTAYLVAAIKRRCQARAWLAVFLRCAACLLCFCAGAGRIGAVRGCFERPDDAFSEGDRVTVQGQVCKIEEREEQFIYYLKDTQYLLGGIAYPSVGILVYSSNVYQPGNILKVAGAYAPFQISRNEGNFNEKQFYRSKQIGFRVYAQEEYVISKKEDRYAIFLRSLQGRLRESFQRAMPQKHAGVMADMALGDKSLLDSGLKGLYQSAGISHILAISGLHVSLMGMGVFRLCRKLRVPQVLASLLAMGMAYSFGLLSGMEISTARAVCMFLLSMAAQASGYSYDSLTALGLCAGIQAWENPFVLEYAGFLFSYGAALGVVVVAKAVKGAPVPQGTKTVGRKGITIKGASVPQGTKTGERRGTAVKGAPVPQGIKTGERKGGGKGTAVKGAPVPQDTKMVGRKGGGKGIRKAGGILWESFQASACIQLATLPISLYFYYECPSYSAAANACVLPFMGPLLFLGLCGASVGCFSALAGKILLAPAGILLSFQEWVCQKTLSLPGAAIVTGKPSLALAVAYYLVLAAALCALYYRREQRWLLVIAAAVCVLLFARTPKQFEVDILDVGQGDGIFVQTGEGSHFFIDGGSSDVKQVGKYRILPFLKAKGISSVAGWVVSHADQDHISGLLELLEEGYPIECLIMAKGMVQDEAAKNLQARAREAGCKILYVKPGTRFGTREAVFTVLHPGAGTGAGGEGSAGRNEASLVVSLAYRSFTGIFTGDIGIGQEEEIRRGGYLSQYGIHHISLYKAAHHGSDGSNSQEFLDCLSPGLTVISCGAGNSYGHPGKEALGRIQKSGSRILCTMEHGQVSVIPREGSLGISVYLSPLVPYPLP